MERKNYIEVDPERCKGCGLCIEACPQKIIQFDDKFNSKGYFPAKLVDPEGKCLGCGFCYQKCPDVAITVFKAVAVK
jgi:2-oxoglutarate ferredoxin oxidoreductase subunit delta